MALTAKEIDAALRAESFDHQYYFVRGKPWPVVMVARVRGYEITCQKDGRYLSGNSTNETLTEVQREIAQDMGGSWKMYTQWLMDEGKGILKRFQALKDK